MPRRFRRFCTQDSRQHVYRRRDRSSLIFEHAPVGGALLDQHGRLLCTNAHMKRLLRCSGDDLDGCHIEALRHAEDVPFADAGAFQPRAIGERWVAERRLRACDGTFFWASIAIAPRVAADGFIAIVEDVTARRQAQDGLATLFDLSPDMLAVAKGEYLIRVNRAFTVVLGHSPETLLNTPLMEFVHPDDRENTVAEVERVCAGRSVAGFTNRWVTSSGEYKWLEWHAKQDPLTGQRHAVGRDLTERHSLQQQMQQMQKVEAIGQLAGGIAHDFNNILTAIIGFADLAEFLIPEGAPGREEVGEVIKASGRAAALTRQLLAFSRRQLLRPEPLDVTNIVLEMGVMLRRLIGEQVRLHVSGPADLWVVEADKVQLEQVMLNLVVNARDAMPHGGDITVETCNAQVDDTYCAMHPVMTPGDYVRVAVSDTGTGMSEEVKARLFEPFFTTKRGASTGMGLATVYGIVKQSGGFIWVYSERGRGTTFKVYLPRSKRARPEPQAARIPAEQLTGSETVLVVDDQRDIVNVIQSVMSRNGYTVLTAFTREEAMEIIKRVGPRLDLLLVDVVMPSVSGPELAAEAMEMVPSLRVLYMSGYASDAAARTGVRLAEAALLEKPFSAAALLRHVRKVMDI